MQPYQGNNRGSEWNKWDLHVHTPYSIVQHYGDGFQEKTWEKYICALENLSPDIKAIGINDYFLLDGYEKVISEKENGRLQNIKLILPVIELRIKSLVGSKVLRRINYHVIFSNELSPEQIRLFFLQGLKIEFELDDGNFWRGNIDHREKLIELGKAIRISSPSTKISDESDLELGFRNAAFSKENIQSTLSHSIFEGKVIKAIGLSEWNEMRWDGSSAAIKKDIINSADLVFTSSPSPSICQDLREKLTSQNVNNKLLNCSDAHFYADSSDNNRLGNVQSWLKADLTFQGLRRVVQRYEARVVIGVKPPKHIHIQNRKSKYIRSIEIRKKEASSYDEIWFDCDIPINSELVAIIGNQGSGKSALTDIIALCGNSKTEEFSFLTNDKFCDREKKAQEFTATLTWEDGTIVQKQLDEKIKNSEVEKIRYVPQGFFEAVTNETTVSEGGRFYGEIKKAVFSHIPESDRLECSSLDELIELRTNEIIRKLKIQRQELATLNLRIFNLESDCSSENVEHFKERINAKKIELDALINEKPIEVEKPKENEEAGERIEELRTQENTVFEGIDQARRSLNSYKKQKEILTQTIDAISSEIAQFEGFIRERISKLKSAGITLEEDFMQYITISVNTKPLSFAIVKINDEIQKIEKKLDKSADGNLISRLENFKDERGKLEAELLIASQEYQNYLNEIDGWERGIDSLKGTSQVEGSLKWLEDQYHSLTVERPLDLRERLQKRDEICKGIYQKLVALASISKDLAQYVQGHIASNDLTREKYKIDFNINLVINGFEDKLFSIVKQSTGSFSGHDEGRETLQQLVIKHDFSSPEGTLEFVNDVLLHLQYNQKLAPPQKMDLVKLIKSGFEVVDIYQLLFGLECIQPQYSLSLNNKPLKQLSPGDRGILLLVFYLIVDQGDEPLIIDQPEGNLNNQSIYKNLVPVFNDAKKRRQIIIVTHNPNLAVVCDAEQIIHSSLDLNDGNRVTYESGSLENPKFNKLSVDVLEGTPPAFDARKTTYEGIL